MGVAAPQHEFLQDIEDEEDGEEDEEALEGDVGRAGSAAGSARRGSDDGEANGCCTEGEGEQEWQSSHGEDEGAEGPVPSGGGPSACATVRRAIEGTDAAEQGGAADATAVAAPTLRREVDGGPRRRWGSVRPVPGSVLPAGGGGEEGSAAPQGGEGRGEAGPEAAAAITSAGEKELDAAAQPTDSEGWSRCSSPESATAESDCESASEAGSTGSWGSQDARRFRESLAPSTSHPGPEQEASHVPVEDAGGAGGGEELSSAEESAGEGGAAAAALAVASTAAAASQLRSTEDEVTGAEGGDRGDKWVARMPVCEALRRAWSAAHAGTEPGRDRT